MIPVATRSGLLQRSEASTRADAQAAALPDILYIMGTGRSGTTILEVLIASSAGFASVGELKHIFRDGFLREKPCACGKTASSCDLWSRVLQSTRWKREDLAQLARLTDGIEAHWRFPFVWSGLVGRRTLAQYRNAAAALYRSIAATSHAPIVVDSSKYPARALLLAKQFPGRVRVLCITRSAAGLFKAFEKKHTDEQKPKSPLAVTLYYLYVLFCMRLVRARLGDRCLAIRFEDLRRDPDEVLRRIDRWSGYRLEGALRKLAENDWFEVGHIVTGNRLRKQGRVKFEAGDASRSEPIYAGLRRYVVRWLEAYRRALGF